MTTPEMLALSLGLSVATAGLAWVGVRLFERYVDDPALRERAWTAALYLPVLPFLMIAVLLAGPRPIVEAPAETNVVATLRIEAVENNSAPVVSRERMALALLGVAVLLGLARGTGLAVRMIRLRRLIACARAAEGAVLTAVQAMADRVGVARPVVRLGPAEAEAMVTGFLKPVLIVPVSLAIDPRSPAFRSVCAHELAHLKRGDHRALWIEELLLTLLAVNPVLRVIRDRRAAAREEACDRQVLAHADGDGRRLYARALLDALRAPAGADVPALTFTSNKRIFVMRRLKAVLSPAPIAGRRSRLAVLGLGIAVSAVAGVGSVAVANQREPAVGPRSLAVLATLPTTKADTRSMPALAPLAAVAPLPKAEPAPRAEPVATPEPTVITNPSWTQMPMPSYPAAALQQGSFNGQADLSCTVEAEGGVSGCTILNETPEGLGYGPAAVTAAHNARLSPRSVEGASVGGTVRFTVRFTRAAE